MILRYLISILLIAFYLPAQDNIVSSIDSNDSCKRIIKKVQKKLSLMTMVVPDRPKPIETLFKESIKLSSLIKPKKVILASSMAEKKQSKTLNVNKSKSNVPTKKKKRDNQASALVAKIDISQQTMRVYSNNKLLYKWKVSTGKKGHGTPRGHYKPTCYAKQYRSRKYNNASMPYSVFFRSGYAIHGTKSVWRLGRRASHGCIRLHTKNAKRFYALVKKMGKSNTSIVITN